MMMGYFSLSLLFIWVIVPLLLVAGQQPHLAASITQLSQENTYVSVIGEPGIKSPNARFALEAWNFCNEVGVEAPNMGSPRMADCADLHCPTVTAGKRVQSTPESEGIRQQTGAGDKFPIGEFRSYTDPDIYAAEKELFLGSLCEVPDSVEPWVYEPTLVYHNQSKMVVFSDNNVSLVGGYYGTYDLDPKLSAGVADKSFFSVTWQKNFSTSSWILSHKLTTSSKYPWLMLYLRADAANGFNGGYHYNGRGIMTKLPESPNFKVRLTLDVKQGGGPNSQFYLLDIGSCWKNNGDPCDGDVLTDVTRYSEMIINPATTSWCRPDKLLSCPPYHISSTGEIIHRNDTSRFPYSAYHLYCAPGNAKYLEKPYDICDPYSNPQAQELVQILPHPEWAVHGYPERKGDGWIGDPRTWELDTGALSSRLYFYQDPGTKLAKRVWSSINVGTEIYVSPNGATAEWTVTDFDVLVRKDSKEDGQEYIFFKKRVISIAYNRIRYVKGLPVIFVERSIQLESLW
ncbi:hypothetical protein Sango_2192200 [Sesamum angolense]|uniref:DUF7705 domain-containing protein n=1 Tax=Sesamum angolense TaxID=2727404 RepID=A0AAE1WDL1_9LAMI|nr:hypothetical protein Sango_2192200 [Sesamum angolense]